MKSFRIIIIMTLFIIIRQTQLSGQETIIQNIVDEVSGDSIFYHIANLQEMKRWVFEYDWESSYYIRNYLEKFEFDTIYFQEYDWIEDNDVIPHVVAVKYGRNSLDSVYIIGAHYDAAHALKDTGDSSIAVSLPGADDNASGTASILESARVLSDYQFEETIMFVLFAAEEVGVWGSEMFVDTLLSKNIFIKGMINLDMIAYTEEENDLEVDIAKNRISSSLAEKCILSLTAYVPGLAYSERNSDAGDHYSFWQKNIPAIRLQEGYPISPYLHTVNDTLGLSANNKILAELITKTTVATMLELDKTGTTNINDIYKSINTDFIISQNYPNPFNLSTTISFILPQSELVKIKIYDVLGREIRTLINKEMQPGLKKVVWNGRDSRVNPVSTGMYFYKLEAGKYSDTKKMLIIK